MSAVLAEPRFSTGVEALNGLLTFSVETSKRNQVRISTALAIPRLVGNQRTVDGNQAHADRSEESQAEQCLGQTTHSDEKAKKNHRLVILKMGDKPLEETGFHAISVEGCVNRSGSGLETSSRIAFDRLSGTCPAEQGGAA